jgi:uncharacterized protein
MRWVAIFHDTPGMATVRTKKGLRDHLTYLRRHGDEIVIAGALRETPGGPIVGGLWVMEVRTRKHAVALIEKDPYFARGYRTYRVLTWAKALADKEAIL